MHQFVKGDPGSFGPNRIPHTFASPYAHEAKKAQLTSDKITRMFCIARCMECAHWQGRFCLFGGPMQDAVWGPLFRQTTMDRLLTLLVIHKDATIYYISRRKWARVVKTSLKLKSNILS